MVRYYDLKGSLIGRRAQKKKKTVTEANVKRDRSQNISLLENESIILNKSDIHHSLKDSIVLGKDQDFLQSEDVNIVLGEREQEKLNKLLQKDVAFLTKLKLMDYSLLLGIAEGKKLPNQNSIEGEPRFKKWRKVYSEAQGQYFSFGIIDYLQIFNYAKYVESTLKSMRYKEKQYSCVEPSVYASRFLNFIGGIFYSNQNTD